MTIDYISDLHLDIWANQVTALNLQNNKVLEFYETFFNKETTSKILIIAGDIGHSIDQNLLLFKYLKSIYKHIVVVLGNHDYYVMPQYDTFLDGLEKAQVTKQRYIDNGIIVLDGNTITIDGIKIAGSMGFYAYDYIKRHTDNLTNYRLYESYKITLEEYIRALWYNTLNDSRMIRLATFEKLYQEEMEKLKHSGYESADIVVTHYIPSIELEHQSPKYRKDMITNFFCFDGEELVKNTRAKYWIYGHTHVGDSFIWHGVNLVTNSVGYPNEELNTRVKSVEL